MTPPATPRGTSGTRKAMLLHYCMSVWNSRGGASGFPRGQLLSSPGEIIYRHEESALFWEASHVIDSDVP